MLTPEQLAHCADDIINLYSQLEEEIVRDIARRITKTGTMTDTGIWQAQHMQELGTLHSDVLSSVAKYSDKTESELRKLFEDAGVMATEYDNEIYRQNGLNPKSLKVSDTQMQLLEAGFRKTQGNLSNLTLTTAVSSQTSFINACSLAELKASSGAFTPQQAIVDAIKQVAQDGAFVIYPSGHRDRLDVAVRRNVMTGIGQTTGQICLSNAQDLGCDLMEITAHAGARPSHAAWQGRIVSLSGQKGYLSLSDIGYGTGDGFKGWNCRHDWYPYFEGSTRMYSEKDLEELNAKNIEYPDGSMHTLYEAEQQQRAYERNIRATKRTLAACDEALNNLSDEELLQKLEKNFSHYSVKLKRQESELNNFCKRTGLLPDRSRQQAYGFGRSTAQKAVLKNKNTIAKSSKKGIINYAKAYDFFSFGDVPLDTKITPELILEDLKTSNKGRETLEYLENVPYMPKLDYYTNTGGLRGEEIRGQICIYIRACKDVKTAVCTLIHEVTHYRYGIGQSQWAECVCVSQELLHRRNRDYLTTSELRTVIKAVKEVYPEFNWRKGGIINGRRRSR